jgi:hypothetical protein
MAGSTSYRHKGGIAEDLNSIRQTAPSVSFLCFSHFHVDTLTL